MFKVLLPAAAALGLVAFAAQTQSADVQSEANALPMGWHLSHEGDMAKLAYGVANSDQLAIMLTCAPGERTAQVYGDVKPAGARLSPAKAGPQPLDPMTGEPELKLNIHDAGLDALARDGKMAVRGEAGVRDIPANAKERRLAADFLAYCQGKRA